MSDGFKIGTASNSMALFSDLGVPEPTRYSFRETAVDNLGGDGMSDGDGFASAVMVWAGSSRATAYRLLKFLGGARSAKLYMRLPKNLAPNLPAAWTTYYGVLYAPVLTGQDGQFVDQSQDAYEGFTLRFGRGVAQ